MLITLSIKLSTSSELIESQLAALQLHLSLALKTLTVLKS
jgi:hypothetical protein